MAETQNFSNHARYYPLVHFITMPIFAINLIWQAVRLYQEPTWDRAELLLLAIGLILLTMAARFQALKAQDRTIRLEELLRHERLLTPDLAFQSSQLPVGSIIALRFASDEELPDLIKRAINGEFKNTKEIKQSIKNWRGDDLRV